MKRLNPPPQRWRRRRRGVFLVGVILILIVTATLLLAFTRSLISQARQSRQQIRHRQATWLADSGAERGLAQAARNAQYQGETWTLDDNMIPGGAKVVIAVTKPENNTQALKRIRVLATYPLNTPLPASVETMVEIPQASLGEGT